MQGTLLWGGGKQRLANGEPRSDSLGIYPLGILPGKAIHKRYHQKRSWVEVPTGKCCVPLAARRSAATRAAGAWPAETSQSWRLLEGGQWVNQKEEPSPLPVALPLPLLTKLKIVLTANKSSSRTAN